MLGFEANFEQEVSCFLAASPGSREAQKLWSKSLKAAKTTEHCLQLYEKTDQKEVKKREKVLAKAGKLAKTVNEMARVYSLLPAKSPIRKVIIDKLDPSR